MSYHHLFALNHQVLANEPGATPLAPWIGRTIASFTEPIGVAWAPREYRFEDIPAINHLALFEYDLHTAAIRAQGFSFEVIPWKTFKEMDRQAVADYAASSPSRSMAPSPQLVISQVEAGLQPQLPDLGEVASTLFTMHEANMAQLRKMPELHTRFGEAVIAAASSRTASRVDVGGISRSPAFVRRLLVHADRALTCFWVFNGLQLVENFDERHWRVLEKKRLIADASP